MRVIKRNPDTSQRELVAKLRMSLGRINYCIKALALMGWIKLGNFVHSDKKLGYLYILLGGELRPKERLQLNYLRENSPSLNYSRMKLNSFNERLSRDKGAYRLSERGFK